MTRCQICGRRLRLNKDGAIAMHHVRSAPCPGAGHPPIEQSDARLVSLIPETDDQARAAYAEIAALTERRVNWIDPALYRIGADASRLRDRLSRRLARHRAWPERFRRQMERQGWGDPPPAYLIERGPEDQGH